jgi:hypothetical protein
LNETCKICNRATPLHGFETRGGKTYARYVCMTDMHRWETHFASWPQSEQEGWRGVFEVIEEGTRGHILLAKLLREVRGADHGDLESVIRLVSYASWLAQMTASRDLKEAAEECCTWDSLQSVRRIADCLSGAVQCR